MSTLADKFLSQFQRHPTPENAKQAFVVCHDDGVPIPSMLNDFLAQLFRKELPKRTVSADTEDDDYRSVLVELMIRIAKSKDNESITSICQQVAEESGIEGDDTFTAGELLRKRMEEFQKRSKVRRK